MTTPEQIAEWLSAPEGRQVLPALSGKQVQNLLRQLRDEGRVQVIGARR